MNFALPCGVASLILVQAAPTVAETDYLLGIAAAHPTVRGVVGWADFAVPDPTQLAERIRNSLLLGLRPMLQDAPDAAALIGSCADPLFEAMAEQGLVFDALVRAEQIGCVTDLAMRHPDLTIVLDHGGKPPLATSDLAPWQAAISALSDHGNVAVKLSGLLTEAAPGDLARPAQAVRFLLDAFGPSRCLWGSDWPVLGAVANYGDWYALVRGLVAERGVAATAAVFGDNARRVYARPKIGS